MLLRATKTVLSQKTQWVFNDPGTVNVLDFGLQTSGSDKGSTDRTLAIRTARGRAPSSHPQTILGCASGLNQPPWLYFGMGWSGAGLWRTEEVNAWL